MSDQGPTSEPSEARPSPLAPLVRGLYRFMVLACLLGILAHAARLVNIGVLWDDGYIFQRYAKHLAEGKGLAWQPDGPPVYGLTALLYVFPALAGRAVTDDPSAAVMLPCFVFGLLFLTAFVRLLWRHVPGRPTARGVGLLLALTCVAVSSTPVHFSSGMDTTFGLTYQALHLMAAARFAGAPSRSRALVLGGHGDTMVPITSACTVNGAPLTEMISKDKLDAIIARTRKGGGEIVGLMGTSAYYAPAVSAVAMAEAYLNDQKRLLAGAAYLEGEYGYEGFFMGVPVVIGEGGVEQIVTFPLTDDEKTMLEASAKAVKDIVQIVESTDG